VVRGYLRSYVCPSVSNSAAPGFRRWDDMRELSDAFQCDALRNAQIGAEWRDRISHRDHGLDRMLAWRREPNCACRRQPLQDACTIGARFLVYLYDTDGFKAFVSKPHEAFVILRFVCDMRKSFPSNIEYVPSYLHRSLFNDDNVLRHVLGTLVQNRSVFAQCMKNLGYFDPLLTSVEWRRLLGSDVEDRSICSCRGNCTENGFPPEAYKLGFICDDAVIDKEFGKMKIETQTPS
jgi:hypothetical protein